MDLLKALDYIHHDLLIVKLHVYGMRFDTVTYLKKQKQNVKVL